MFTGIIRSIGIVSRIVEEGDNVHFTIESDISKDCYVDQSIAHSGVCLTVVKKTSTCHTVTAIKETLLKSNLGDLKIGYKVNIELAMQAGERLDGHMVQGHVDGLAICENIQEENGSWLFTFSIPEEKAHLVVEKGSICINGVSLTVFNVSPEEFTVAIIPYTFEHTQFNSLEIGDAVNIEYDILGKYVAKYMAKITK